MQHADGAPHLAALGGIARDREERERADAARARARNKVQIAHSGGDIEARDLAPVAQSRVPEIAGDQSCGGRKAVPGGETYLI